MARLVTFKNQPNDPTPEDQAWLDEQLLDARREFPAQVFEAHEVSRWWRSPLSKEWPQD